jgi:hypothetical protein
MISTTKTQIKFHTFAGMGYLLKRHARRAL